MKCSRIVHEYEAMGFTLGFVWILTAFILGTTACAEEVSLSTICVTVGSNDDDKIYDKTIAVWLEHEDTFEVPESNATISQKDAKFSPKFQVISVGQTIDMPNDDNIIHNVFSISEPKIFNLGVYGKGESKLVTFDQPGFVEIYCSIHQHMSAEVLVVHSNMHAVGKLGEEVKIQEVPAGIYTLVIWHQKLGRCAQRITVDSAQSKDECIKLQLNLEQKIADLECED